MKSEIERCRNCNAPISSVRFVIQGKDDVYCSSYCASMYAALDASVVEQKGTPAEVKDPYNPKDSVGVRKWRQYTSTPCTFVWGLGVAFLEGARKYGRHNYRAAPVRASVYMDAAKGHIDQFWEGEDIDKDSRLHHLIKAGASLAVLFDAIVAESWVDDRPPRIDLEKFRTEMQEAVDHIFERIPDAKPAFTEKGRNPDA